MQLKRENWKNKYIWVVRDHGKIRAIRKYKKYLTKERMVRIYKKNNTLFEDYKKTKLKKVTEVSDYRPAARRPAKTRSQYIVEVKLSDGHVIQARSQRHGIEYSKGDMRREAWDNASRMAAYYWTGESDTETGLRIINEDSVNVREGVVHYGSV